MVGFPADVRDRVLLGGRRRRRRARAGSVLVDMTTTEPSLAVEIASAAAAREAHAHWTRRCRAATWARATRTLSIMAGGDAAAFERVRPLLEAMGKTIVHEGGPGAGQHTKMCNQIVIAGTMIGVCESLLYGACAPASISRRCCSRSAAARRDAGRSTTSRRACSTATSIRGSWSSTSSRTWASRSTRRARMKLALPGLALVRQLYVAASAQGTRPVRHARLYLALRRLSGD